MKVGIIGAGFTGLAAAYFLSKRGHDVTLIEKDDKPGGLAVGFDNPSWDWSLEKHYHHFFTNDKFVINLAKEIGHKIIVKRPKTSVYVDNEIIQLDSPGKVLGFNKLNLTDRIRMATALALLRYNPLWRILENYKASDILPKIMGRSAYEKVWEPQLVGKFGDYADVISLAWFWARVKKRTTELAYPEGGFLRLAESIEKEIKKLHGTFVYRAQVGEIKSDKRGVRVKITRDSGDSVEHFDKLIVTLPGALFKKIAPDLPKSYISQLDKLEGIGAINIVLRLRKKFFSDNTYWLSICNKDFPFLAVVEHTNLLDKKNYNNEHIVYVGKYAAYSHPFFKSEDKELLKIYDPFLKKINADYKKDLIGFAVFKAPFAQPIIPTKYSKIIPPFTTPLTNVYLANIQQVYPWDRGTNYAVELGEKVAELI